MKISYYFSILFREKKSFREIWSNAGYQAAWDLVAGVWCPNISCLGAPVLASVFNWTARECPLWIAKFFLYKSTSSGCPFRISKFSALFCSAWWVKLKLPVAMVLESKIMILLWAMGWWLSMTGWILCSIKKCSSVYCSLSLLPSRTMSIFTPLFLHRQVLGKWAWSKRVGLNQDFVSRFMYFVD